jgi:hypothetical protein
MQYREACLQIAPLQFCNPDMLLHHFSKQKNVAPSDTCEAMNRLEQTRWRQRSVSGVRSVMEIKALNKRQIP